MVPRTCCSRCPRAAPTGSRAHVEHVLTQPAAVTSMAMFILGVLVIAGEYRQRTILGTFLAQPRRGRILIVKLLTTGALTRNTLATPAHTGCGASGPHP